MKRDRREEETLKHIAISKKNENIAQGRRNSKTEFKGKETIKQMHRKIYTKTYCNEK